MLCAAGNKLCRCLDICVYCKSINRKSCLSKATVTSVENIFQIVNFSQDPFYQLSNDKIVFGLPSSSDSRLNLDVLGIHALFIFISAF